MQCWQIRGTFSLSLVKTSQIYPTLGASHFHLSCHGSTLRKNEHTLKNKAGVSIQIKAVKITLTFLVIKSEPTMKPSAAIWLPWYQIRHQYHLILTSIVSKSETLFVRTYVQIHKYEKARAQKQWNAEVSPLLRVQKHKDSQSVVKQKPLNQPHKTVFPVGYSFIRLALRSFSSSFSVRKKQHQILTVRQNKPCRDLLRVPLLLQSVSFKKCA